MLSPTSAIMTPTNRTNRMNEELTALLAEPEAAAVERARVAFDELAGPFADRLVLYGAGNLGRKTLAGIRSLGIEPLAFSDGNSALWARTSMELPCFPQQTRPSGLARRRRS